MYDLIIRGEAAFERACNDDELARILTKLRSIGRYCSGATAGC